jgi:hypothetical protein
MPIPWVISKISAMTSPESYWLILLHRSCRPNSLLLSLNLGIYYIFWILMFTTYGFWFKKIYGLCQSLHWLIHNLNLAFHVVKIFEFFVLCFKFGIIRCQHIDFTLQFIQLSIFSFNYIIEFIDGHFLWPCNMVHMILILQCDFKAFWHKYNFCFQLFKTYLLCFFMSNSVVIIAFSVT